MIKNKKHKTPGRPRTATTSGLLPVFDSMKQCTARTGIPGPLLKRAKKTGCEAFKWNRVDLALFLRWFFEGNSGVDATDWSNELAKWKAQREQLRVSKESGKYIETAKVVAAIRRIAPQLRTILRRKLVGELPAQAVGKDCEEIRRLCQKLDDELLQAFGELAAEWPES